MVKRRIIRILSGTMILIALVAVMTALLYVYLNRDQEMLAAIIKGRIEQRFETEVSIGKASTSVLKGPQVELSDIRFGNRTDDLYLTAQALDVKLGFWPLLHGNIEIDDAVLINPDMTIRLSEVSGEPPLMLADLPRVAIHGGSLRVLHGKAAFALDHIEGVIKSDRIHGTMDALGGAIDISIDRGMTSWGGSIQIHEAKLDQIDKRIDGVSNVELNFNLGFPRNNLSVGIDTKNLLLPWWKEKLKNLSVSFEAGGTTKRIAIQKLAIRTPIVDISGTGSISEVHDLAGLADAPLDLALSSSEFDYEKLVALLPVKQFPSWLSLLLTRQIRGGASRFSATAYSGSIGKLVSGEDILTDLSVTEELKGMSFGAGHDENRATDITGTFIISKGDIAFKNLSGRIGDSRIASVDLNFHDVRRPGMQLSVGVSLDMDVRDFPAAWRAAMVPKSIYEMLNPLSQTKGGRISASVETYTDTDSKLSTSLRGKIQLSGCSFQWGGRAVQGLTGAARKKDFASPVQIDAQGIVDGYSVKTFKLSLSDPFGAQLYSLSMVTDGLPMKTGTVRFEKETVLRVTGTGNGPRFKGDINIKTSGMSIRNGTFRPVEGMIEGRGRLEVLLRPRLNLKIDETLLTMAPGRVTLEGEINESKGFLTISGDIRLNQLGAFTDQYKPLDGSVRGDIRIDWERTAAVTGFINCRNARIAKNGSTIGIEGPLKIGKKKISSKRLDVRYDGMICALSGALTLSQPMKYTGDIAIDGFSFTKGEAGEGDIPRGIEADAALELTNANIYGVPVDSASARLTLDSEVLRLKDLEARILSGIATGILDIHASGETNLDLGINLENAEIKRLYNTMYPGKPRLDGKLDLTGRIWGSTALLNGDLLFSARQGRVLKYSLLSKIFSVLNVYKILKSGEFDLIEEGFPYNRISASITIRDGIAKFDDFLFDSNSLQMSSVGRYSINKKEIDAVVTVQPFETIDKVLGLIPVVGWILTGDDNRFVIVNLTVKGKIEDPDIRVAPIDTLSKPVVGILLRTLKLPIEIIRNPQKMIPGMSNEQDAKDDQ